MATHSDLTPEMIANAEQKLARRIELLMGFEEGRVTVKLFDPAMPGKTGMEFNATPPLTQQEEAQILSYIKAMNAMMGGSPIIEPGKA